VVEAAVAAEGVADTETATELSRRMPRRPGSPWLSQMTRG
jgi:hypothetical protein